MNTSNGGAWLSAVGVLNDDPEPTSDIKDLDISVHRAGLDDGTYFGRIILHTNGGDVTIQVVMIARDSPPLPPNFNIFVRLVNMETGKIAGTSIVNPATGLDFDFAEIPDGKP